jgi:hypothetical protein
MAKTKLRYRKNCKFYDKWGYCHKCECQDCIAIKCKGICNFFVDNSTEELLLSGVIKSVCVHCGTDKNIRVIDGSYWCKKCRTGW